MAIFNSSVLSFKLQNGKEILEDFFDDIMVYEYTDHLEICNVKDLVDYIFTFKNMANISEKEISGITEFLKNKADKNGIIRVTKQSGTFMANRK